MRYGVVLLHTIHAVFRLEKELRARGLAVSLIPTPRHLSSDCGTALRFDPAGEASVRAAIEDLNLEIQGLHWLER